MLRHTERRTDIIIIISLSGVGTNWKRLTKEITWTINTSLLVKKGGALRRDGLSEKLL